MSKEINNILTAYRRAHREERQAALATVVHVEGSSYRRPGARMLVEDNGRMTGTISGGCLEADALKKALLAINQGQNKLVTYNTLDEDDAAVGVQLGCNGIVHILFEPIDALQANNPIALLEKFTAHRTEAVLITLFSLDNYHGIQPGTCGYFDAKQFEFSIANAQLENEIRTDALLVLATKNSLLKQYSYQELTGFVELLEPPVSLLLIGAGNDVMPLADMAAILGWQISIADGRVTHANRNRFPKADQLIVGKPAEIIEKIEIDERTAIVLMTHNYQYDKAMLQLLLQQKCRYIGSLGPKKKLQRMLAELMEENILISEEQLLTIYGPTGLDIGAETPEEIALSILAEIKAVFADRQGGYLQLRTEGIHTAVDKEMPLLKVNNKAG